MAGGTGRRTLARWDVKWQAVLVACAVGQAMSTRVSSLSMLMKLEAAQSLLH